MEDFRPRIKPYSDNDAQSISRHNLARLQGCRSLRLLLKRRITALRNGMSAVLGQLLVNLFDKNMS
jgi:hypothetical protein